MRGILYVVIPAVVLGLVLANAFYGHVLFGYAYDRAINKYSVYVHLQPGWESHPGNILFDVTNVWSGHAAAAAAGGDGKSGAATYLPGSTDPDDISSLTSYNRNQLQYQKSKPYVELRHEFSGCETQWRPIPYRYAADALRSWSEVASGVQAEGPDGEGAGHVEPAFAEAGAGDPYVMVFPNAPNAAYGPDAQSELVRDGYAQVIPVCVAPGAAGRSTYDYAIMVNDPDIGFDAYFVRSAEDAAAHVSSGRSGVPAFYEGPGCHVTNHNSFAGTCHGVERGSGLLIIVPDMLDLSLTKVRVGLHERPQ